MAKVTQDKNTAPQTELDDALDVPVFIPNGKLDADQYSADDLDGVTESLFGSGNMAYASLQASQTEAMQALNDGVYDENGLDLGALKQPIDTDRPVTDDTGEGVEIVGSEGNYSNTTIGSIGVSTLSSDVASFDPESNLNLSTADFSEVNTPVTNNSNNNSNRRIDTESNEKTTNNYYDLDTELSLDLDLDILDTIETGLGVTIDDSIEGALDLGATTENLASIVDDLTGLSIPVIDILGAGINFDLLGGGDVDDGRDISIAGLNTPEIDLDILEDIVGDIDINLDIADLTDVESLTQNLENTLNSLNDLDIAGLGDILGTIGDQSIGGTLDAVIGTSELTQDFDVTVEDVVNNVTTNLDNVATGADELLDDLTGGATDDITDLVEETVDEVTDVVDDLLAGDTDSVTEAVDNIAQDAGEVVDDLTGGATEDLTDAVEDTINDVTNVVDDLLDDSDLDVGLTDLVDQVEADAGELVDDLIGGATDELTDLAEDVTDEVTDIADAVVEGVTDVVDELTGDSLDGVTDLVDDLITGEAEQTAEETFEDAIEDTTEIVEDILSGGDVLDDMLGLLDGGQDNAETDSQDDASWTENPIDEVGGLFDDLVQDAGGDGDILPDPLGTVGEGLGILDVDPDSGGGALGGLFG